jgi:hypothetical protein
MGVHLTGVHLMGIHFMGMHLMGVYLTGICLTGVYLIPCTTNTLCSLISFKRLLPGEGTLSGDLVPKPCGGLAPKF